MNRNSIFCLIYLLVVFAIIPQNIFAKSDKKFVVVLDAGHGGGDVGTPHRKMKKDEKTIALDVVLRIGKLIESNYSDVKVVYTRKKDVYPSLPERTQIAKEAQGDLFISVHINAAPNAAARGIETYVFGVTGLAGKSADEQKRIKERMANERENLDISGKQIDFEKDMDIETKILCQAQREKNNIHSEEVAKYVHISMISAIRKTSYKANLNDRGIKEKNIFVLCYSPMPAILVELGYMSNAAEEKFLNSEEALSAFSKAIYNGFEKYKKSWDKRKLNASDVNNEVSDIKDNTSEPEESSATSQTSNEDNTVYYKIQFLSSDKLIKQGNSAFKGLNPVDNYKDGAVYRYTYGKATSSSSLNADLKKVKKLFPDAFIIKTDAKGKRIR